VTTSGVERRPRRGRRARSRPLYWLAGLIVAAVLFGAGVAVGEALHDNPTPGITQTSVRTLHP
jgi:anti-sigma factor RsiW